MKLRSNYVLRSTLEHVLLLITIIVPLGVGLPFLTGTNRTMLCVFISILAVAETIAIIFDNYAKLVSPIKSLNDASKKLSSGEYSVRINQPHVDEEVRRLSINMNNIANEFESLEQMRKSFVSNASHELRSPLTSIQGFLEAILDGTIAEEDREKYLKITLNETKRLGQLISSMLDLSRLESGKTVMNMSRFDINVLIHQVATRFEQALSSKDMHIDCVFDKEQDNVYADREQILRVLINLVDNAIKYSPRETSIVISTHSKGKKLYVKVKDSGNGIEPKDQPHIWDRFYMADEARTPNKSKGTGLGLSIVKKIIDEHNETIWVESNVGIGSTFIFTLSRYDKSKHRDDETEIGNMIEESKE